MKNYNQNIYMMYEEECEKNILLSKENSALKLENSNLKYELDYIKKSLDKKIDNSVSKATKPLIKENDRLLDELSKAHEEIDRLKTEIENKDKIEEKDYIIDKLTSQVNKDSTNSSIPTSKEFKHKNKRTGANTYNHRTTSNKTSGGQPHHKGNTLTKEIIEEKIKVHNIEVREKKHYINGQVNAEDMIKYKVGVIVKPYVEKHIFISNPNSKEKLPKTFYSDVTYNNDLKAVVVLLGNYCSIPYNKIKELISDLTNGIINISEGTIDNIYEEFSTKTEETIHNIATNLINGKYQHTDETSTKENGKETYYRGYANKQNVLYKYHHRKGDKPIEEDKIITNYYGTIISDHDTGIFKYGTNNQDCVIHIGRYCKEQEQNVNNIEWPMQIYQLLLKFERNRKIVAKYGKEEFSEFEIKAMEKEYDEILELAKEQNKEIASTYWKEKANTLLKRLTKYKSTILFYLHDFDIDYDNNFMERALRMIKGKTKVSGGFRSESGAIRFGNIMSVIKTAKLRNMNPFSCIKAIFQGQTLFA